jgi:uncharacterized membrane protein YedE/YeeE
MATAFATPTPVTASHPARRLAYAVLGAWFGVVLIKSQVVSWFRIQEMFRFQSFYMYGVLSSAVLVAGIAITLLKHFSVRTLDGAEIVIPPKAMGRGLRYAIGGTIFGIGWACTGACPGPLFALIGAGVSVMIVTVIAALAGTWLYGYARSRLPH